MLCCDGMCGAEAELALTPARRCHAPLPCIASLTLRSWSHRGVLDELASMSTIECRQYAQIR